MFHFHRATLGRVHSNSIQIRVNGYEKLGRFKATIARVQCRISLSDAISLKIQFTKVIYRAMDINISIKNRRKNGLSWNKHKPNNLSVIA